MEKPNLVVYHLVPLEFVSLTLRGPGEEDVNGTEGRQLTSQRNKDYDWKFGTWNVRT